ncbi:hypothetical protein K2X85_19630 [bacterium]|nr:hypothetical protein [bacterium]
MIPFFQQMPMGSQSDFIVHQVDGLFHVAKETTDGNPEPTLGRSVHSAMGPTTIPHHKT